MTPSEWLLYHGLIVFAVISILIWVSDMLTGEGKE